MQRYSGFGLFKHSLSHHENWQRMWRNPTPKPVYDVVIVGGGGHGHEERLPAVLAGGGAQDRRLALLEVEHEIDDRRVAQLAVRIEPEDPAGAHAHQLEDPLHDPVEDPVRVERGADQATDLEQGARFGLAVPGLLVEPGVGDGDGHHPGEIGREDEVIVRERDGPAPEPVQDPDDLVLELDGHRQDSANARPLDLGDAHPSDPRVSRVVRRVEGLPVPEDPGGHPLTRGHGELAQRVGAEPHARREPHRAAPLIPVHLLRPVTARVVVQQRIGHETEVREQSPPDLSTSPDHPSRADLKFIDVLKREAANRDRERVTR